jgi:hypothetical protein
MSFLNNRISFSILNGLLGGWSCYYLFFQIPGVVSKTRLGYGIILCLLLITTAYLIFPWFIQKRGNIDHEKKVNACLSGIILSCFVTICLLISPQRPIENFLIPTTQITFSPESQNNNSLEFLWLHNGFRDVSLKTIKVENGYEQETQSGIHFTPEQYREMHIIWKGLALSELTGVLKSPGGMIRIETNNAGSEKIVIFSKPDSAEYSFRIPVSIPWQAWFLPNYVIILTTLVLSTLLMEFLYSIHTNQDELQTNKKNPLEILPYGLSFMLSAAAILFVAYIGFSNRYLYDDYCYAAFTKNQGFSHCLITNLLHTNGRFSQMCLLCLMDLIQPVGFQLSVGFSQILLFISFFFLIKSFISNQNRLQVAVMAGFLQMILLILVPYIAHAIFWYSGMVTVIPSLIGYNFIICAIMEQSRLPRNNYFLIGIFILAFITTGINETLTAVAIGSFILILFLSWIPFYKFLNIPRIPLFIALLGAFAGFIVMSTLPGTSARISGYEQPASLIKLITVIFGNARESLITIFHNDYGVTLFLLIGIGGLLSGLLIRTNFASQRQKVIVSGTLLLFGIITYTGSFLPAAYALNGNMPQRTMIIPLYFLVLQTFFSMFFLGNTVKILERSKIAWGMSIIGLFLFWGMLKLYLPISQIYSRYARGFDLRESQIVGALASGQNQIEVEPIVDSTDLFGDIKAQPGYWVNQCASNYYGIEIRLK